MPSPFEVMFYLRALQARWKRIAAVALVAAATALALSLLLPKKYDATVTLVIQPAGAGGPYPATMSPVYLEYLRSYEHFLQSDGLLDRLLREFKLDRPPYNYTAEGFRSSALRVTLVRNTKVLKVRVRFSEPQKAQEIALGLARLAAQSNTEINLAEAARAAGQIGKDREEARARLAAAQAALEKFRRQSRGEELERQVAQQIERKVESQGKLSQLQVDLAEKEARLATLSAQWRREPEKFRLEQGGRASEVLNPARQQLQEEMDLTAADVEGLRARQKALRAELAEVEAPLARNQAARASLDLRRQELESAYDLAQNALISFTNRANDARFTTAARHEELQIADPGVVPARPSSPNVLLNVLLAAFLGLLGSVLYETWVWNWRQEQRALDALVGPPKPSGPRVGVS